MLVCWCPRAENTEEIECHHGEPDAVNAEGLPIYPDAYEQVMINREGKVKVAETKDYYKGLPR